MHSNPTMHGMTWWDMKKIEKVWGWGCQAGTFQSLVPKALTQFAPATNNVAPQNAVERAFAAFIAPWLPATSEASIAPLCLHMFTVFYCDLWWFSISFHRFLWSEIVVAQNYHQPLQTERWSMPSWPFPLLWVLWRTRQMNFGPSSPWAMI